MPLEADHFHAAQASPTAFFGLVQSNSPGEKRLFPQFYAEVRPASAPNLKELSLSTRLLASALRD